MFPGSDREEVGREDDFEDETEYPGADLLIERDAPLQPPPVELLQIKGRA
jgi:hypothetical protein